MDVLYLFPCPDNPLSIQASTLSENQPNLRRGRPPSHQQARALHNATVQCLAVHLQSSASGPTKSTIGSYVDADLYLPLDPGQGNIDLALGYERSTLDLAAEPALSISQGSLPDQVRTFIYDPINKKEAESDFREVLNGVRYLKSPRTLQIGPYIFLVTQPETIPTYEQRCAVAFWLDANACETEWRATGGTLGEGSFGKVTLLRGMKTGQLRACKTIKVHAANKRSLASVRNEVAIMNRLSGQAHILQCFRAFQETKYERDQNGSRKPVYHIFSLHLQPCHGDLNQLINTGFCLYFFPIAATEIAVSIALTHAAGVAHRAIKPANILIRGHGRGDVEFGEILSLAAQGRLKLHFLLADFGLAKNINEGLRSFAGTELYMAPEQANKDYSDSVDILSFAITLLEMIFTAEIRAMFRQFAPAMNGKRVCPARAALQDQIYTFVTSKVHMNALMPLLVRMMDPDPTKRPLADRIVQAFAAMDWQAVMASFESRGATPTLLGSCLASTDLSDMAMLDVPETVIQSEGDQALSLPRDLNRDGNQSGLQSVIHANPGVVSPPPRPLRRGFCASTVSTDPAIDSPHRRIAAVGIASRTPQEMHLGRVVHGSADEAAVGPVRPKGFATLAAEMTPVRLRSQADRHIIEEARLLAQGAKPGIGLFRRDLRVRRGRIPMRYSSSSSEEEEDESDQPESVLSKFDSNFPWNTGDEQSGERAVSTAADLHQDIPGTCSEIPGTASVYYTAAERFGHTAVATSKGKLTEDFPAADDAISKSRLSVTSTSRSVREHAPPSGHGLIGILKSSKSSERSKLQMQVSFNGWTVPQLSASLELPIRSIDIQQADHSAEYGFSRLSRIEEIEDEEIDDEDNDDEDNDATIKPPVEKDEQASTVITDLDSADLSRMERDMSNEMLQSNVSSGPVCPADKDKFADLEKKVDEIHRRLVAMTGAAPQLDAPAVPQLDAPAASGAVEGIRGRKRKRTGSMDSDPPSTVTVYRSVGLGEAFKQALNILWTRKIKSGRRARRPPATTE